MSHACTKNDLIIPFFLHAGKSFIELVQFVFTVPSVDSFLSQRICQDPLERFFGLQRQRGGVHENPNVVEFTTNTQALRVVNSFCHAPYRGNCRSGPSEQQEDALHKPLSKRPHHQRHLIKLIHCQCHLFQKLFPQI